MTHYHNAYLQIHLFFWCFAAISVAQLPARSAVHPQPLPKHSTIISPKKTKKVPFFTALFDNFHTVERGKLYRSMQLSPRRLNYYIKRLRIKSVINLRGYTKNAEWWKAEKAVVDANHAQFYNIPMKAEALPQKEQILKLLDVYAHAPRPILVHCFGGADRSGEAAALWILVQQKRSKRTALKQLTLKYRHIQSRYPAKRFFIHMWKGVEWLKRDYNPLLYPQFTKKVRSQR